MPSCQACGKWYSEEDNGCGCDNEILFMTRKELRKIVGRVLRKVAGDESLRFGDFLEPELLLMEANAYESGELEVPGE